MSQLSPLDVAFLCMEDASNPMHLGAVATFAPRNPVHPARIVALLCERALEVPALRRRVRFSWVPPGGASWVDDPAFAVEDHVVGHHLRGRRGFAELVSHVMAQPLDLGRPPWEVHVITGVTGGRFAVVVKMHHALCDGMKAVGLGLRLMDGFDQVPDVGVPAARTGVVDGVKGLVRAAGIASDVVRSARPPARRSPVVSLSSRRRHVVMARLGVDEVHRVRRTCGGTVNDVMLALVTGALRQWLAAHGCADEGSTLRALVPVARRGAGGAGNRISGYLCELPVGEVDPLERLRLVREDMGRHKAAGADRGAGALPLLAEHIPSVVHRIAAPIAGKCAPLLFDALVTSVPLPAVRLELDGAELREVYPVPPVAAGHAVGVAVSSYRSGVHVCLHTDQPWMAESRWLQQALRTELAALHRRVPAQSRR
ncbi:wax ester/triacylglycerol synthase family O-acyltransferase [Saccharothrix variisporea]|uniref:Diacylglycerol O-acyltransferase n=1 Tax=Saccharothrix variisporea TaxID=543527 RepID=A0A495XNE6_9PSEU|nr:wax ester/triacylglycerol synthase family O-acyltransferase [Saccharothrix variisporea]RKT73993.1 diacylglycerol O-acyltransferase [Saccharothrix variisporea]